MHDYGYLLFKSLCTNCARFYVAQSIQTNLRFWLANISVCCSGGEQIRAAAMKEGDCDDDFRAA